MVLVVDEVNVGKLVVKDRGLAPQLQRRERLGHARELQANLVEVVLVDVAVTTGPDELTDPQVTLLRNHVGEQGVAGDVEGHAQKHVGAALVQLAAKAAICYPELEQAVAGRQGHVRQVAHVPGAHDVAAGLRVGSDVTHDVSDLVDWPHVTPLGGGGHPAAPLGTVDRAE